MQKSFTTDVRQKPKYAGRYMFEGNFKPHHTIGLFLHPLKTSENHLINRAECLSVDYSLLTGDVLDLLFWIFIFDFLLKFKRGWWFTYMLPSWEALLKSSWSIHYFSRLKIELNFWILRALGFEYALGFC